MRKLVVSFIAFLLLGLSSLAMAATVNINTADASALAATIKGVGEKKAAAIIAYRKSHGSFKSVDDLANVKGISQKTIEANRDNLSVSGK